MAVPRAVNAHDLNIEARAPSLKFVSFFLFYFPFIDNTKVHRYRPGSYFNSPMSPHHPSSTPDWQALGGLSTALEIAQQPTLWRALAAQLQALAEPLQALRRDWLGRPECRVIFTGAGSSAYIGELVAAQIASQWLGEICAVSTTSLLTHPTRYLKADRPTLLVSFARSGSSPESLGAVALLRQQVPDVQFLHITCNADGELARQAAGDARALTLLMPPASCDRGFAMTSSFSCMLLAGLAALDAGNLLEHLARIEALAQRAEQALRDWNVPLQALAAQPFQRIVYLASGPLEALAQEAALKVLELSAGRVLALANTPLGFRHGPKSVVNESTLIVLMRSADALARRYEQDLIDELQRDGIAAHLLSVGPALDGKPEAAGTLQLPLPDGPTCGDAWLAPLWLLAAQTFALHKSAALGLTPDNPFPDGTVNRVVQGVTLYVHGV